MGTISFVNYSCDRNQDNEKNGKETTEKSDETQPDTSPLRSRGQPNFHFISFVLMISAPLICCCQAVNCSFFMGTLWCCV